MNNLRAQKPTLPELIGSTVPRASLATQNIPPAAMEEARFWRRVNRSQFYGRISPKSVMYVTASYFGVSYAVLYTSISKSYSISRPKHAAVYIMALLCVTATGEPFAYQRLSEYVGIDNHLYAFNAVRAAINNMNKHTDYRNAIYNIIDLLMAGDT